MDVTVHIKTVLYKKADKVIGEFIDDLKDHFGETLYKTVLTEDLILELYRIYRENRSAGASKYL